VIEDHVIMGEAALAGDGFDHRNSIASFLSNGQIGIFRIEY
jgi:hypothetical protein